MDSDGEALKESQTPSEPAVDHRQPSPSPSTPDAFSATSASSTSTSNSTSASVIASAIASTSSAAAKKKTPPSRPLSSTGIFVEEAGTSLSLSSSSSSSASTPITSTGTSTAAKKSNVVHRPRSSEHTLAADPVEIKPDSGGSSQSGSASGNVIFREAGSALRSAANAAASSLTNLPSSFHDLPSPLKKQGAKLRSLWAAIRAKRPLHLIRRHASSAAQEAWQMGQEFLEKLPNAAKIVVLVLLGLIKLLFLVLILGANCHCRQPLKNQQPHNPSKLAFQDTQIPSSSPFNLRAADYSAFEVTAADYSAFDSLAVLLSGDPRYLPFTGASLVRHVIEPFPSPHVFLSAELNEHAHRLSTFAEVAAARRGTWQLVSARVWAAPGVSRKVWGSLPHRVRRQRETQNMVSRWWLVEDCFSQLREQESKYSIKYKWVVQASFDQFWSAPVPPFSFSLDHEVAVPFTAPPGGLNDLAAVAQRRAAQRFIPRLEGLARVYSAQGSYSGQGSSEAGDVGEEEPRSSAVLFRLGLAPNMIQHVGFVSLPFCRLSSSDPGAILAVGSLGAVDGFPCHPCKEIVRGQPGWALASKGPPEGFAPGAIPTVLPNQIDRIGVCYGKLTPFGPGLYNEWNSGLETGRLLNEFANMTSSSSSSSSSNEGGATQGGHSQGFAEAARQLYSGAHQWQGELQGHRDCMSRVRKLAEGGALPPIGPRGGASLQGGGTPESLCTRWLMGPMVPLGADDWPVFTRFLSKDSNVYQFGIGSTMAFIKGVTRVFGCHVHGFDETPRSIQWMKSQRLPMRFHHVPHMLGTRDGMELRYLEERDGLPTFFASAGDAGAAGARRLQGRSIQAVMRLMKHTKIDVAVLDMRGVDADIILSWMPGSEQPRICQLLVRHYETSPSRTFKDEVPWEHLSNLGFVLASSNPVWKGFLYLFYHPDSCLGTQRQN